jgi:hypothetical protein
VPLDRPSDRSTARTLPSNGENVISSAQMIELSGADLVSDRELSRVLHAVPPPPVGHSDGDVSLRTLVHGALSARPEIGLAPSRPSPNFYPCPWPDATSEDRSWETKETVRPAAPPPIQEREAVLSRVAQQQSSPVAALRASSPPASSWAASTQPPPLRRALVPIVLSHLVLAAAVFGLIAGLSRGQKRSELRDPRVAAAERNPLADRTVTPPPPPPSQGCATSGASRMLAPHAQIGPGLDVNVLETGFGVGLATGSKEGLGLRVDATGLRVIERLRVKTSSVVSHVAAVQGHDDESEALDVRIDEGDARTVLGAGYSPAFRVLLRGGTITALVDDPQGARTRPLWFVPATKGSPGRAVNEIVRAVGRDDGGAIVALRRPALLWVGVVDPTLAPAGPLVAIFRKGATVGTPALATWGGGGAVAWAEKPAGEREWVIVVASFTPDGEGATNLGHVRVVGRGMSPSLAELPDGDLLLAHSDGPSGAHRVVALRLGRDLAARGAPVVVSPASANAGQPVAAVRSDGRALVAFFAADRGRAAASVLATPLACDPGL